MKKSLLLAKAKLRRSRAQMLSIFVLLLTASMLLNIWLMLAFDYKKNFERCHDRLNSEHITAVFDQASDELQSCVSEILKEDTRITQYTVDKTLWLAASIDYNGGTLSSNFFLLEKEAALSRLVGRFEIIDEGEEKSGIYLPLIFGKGNNYSVGDVIHITSGTHTFSYTVCGFYNSAMTGSHNCAMCALLLTKDIYQELEEEALLPDSLLFSVRIEDKAQSEDFEAAIKNAVSADFPSVRTLSNAYTVVSNSRYISQMVCSGIVSAMACFITIIALVVTASNIVNDIQENMKDLGALKAIGYTGGQLVGALLFQFLGLSLISLAAGTALSYCLFPAVNEMMISQTGIPYEIHFLLLPFVVTFAAVIGTIAVVVWLSSRTIKITEPITALRQGVKTHNFKRNHIPLESAHIPLDISLALKMTLSGIKQNITICITMIVLSLIIVFSGVMTRNVIFDMQPMINLIMGETSDSCINIAAELEQEFLEAVGRDSRVEKVYLYNDIEVWHVGHIGLNAFIIDDCSRLNNQKLCVEGRFPKYNNEILLGAKYAKEQGLSIGDEITLTTDGNSASFLISGFTQTSNSLGKDCLMLRGGYERMGRLSYVNYAINVAEHTDIDALNQDISETLGGNVEYVVNINDSMVGMASGYVSIVTVIVVGILILSVVVILFVLFLLVKTLLTRRKQDYGVLKALGFTTGQLILQTALSFMPSVILSLIIGIIISCVFINPLIAVFLSGIGMIKCTFEIPVLLIAAAGIAIAAIAFGFVCLLSLKVRKITPKALLTGE